jgi:hypothetical protein
MQTATFQIYIYISIFTEEHQSYREAESGRMPTPIDDHDEEMEGRILITVPRGVFFDDSSSDEEECSSEEEEEEVECVNQDEENVGVNEDEDAHSGRGTFPCTVSTSSGPSEEEAPFHILMSTERPLQEMLARDDCVQNDYLTRRFRCLHGGGGGGGNGGSSQQQDVWSAATPLERALTECCELGRQNDGNDSTVLRGALVRGKEGSFVSLLALHCHTLSTRALVLAIVQRTMEQDELEEENQEELTKDEVNDEKSEKNAKTKPGGDESEKPLPESANENERDSCEKSKKSVETNSHQEAEKAEKIVQNFEDKEEEEDGGDNVGRMGRFLAAGGLKILKQWLEDAMTPVKTVVPKVSPQAGTTKKEASRVVVQTVASPTGPLLRPLLTVLTDMPFDKNLTMRVKINKQIRKLKKHLDEAIALHQVKKGVDEWTDPVAGGLVVVEVRGMVEALMKRWEERMKTSTLATKDPFESLRAKMRERLDVLKKYEAGESSKPTWLEASEEKERHAREQEELSKMTTEQRAARERLQEREQMLKHAQKQQNESKAKRELLLKKSREESQKRMAEGSLGGDVKRTQRVKWKDGLENSDNFRRRSLLEQVYVYLNHQESSNGSNLKQEPHDENDWSANGKQELDEGNDDGIIQLDAL